MNQTDEFPLPNGSPLTAYDATLALMRRLGVKKVLDCPAGRGAFAKRAINAGYEVTCADIFPEDFELDNECSFADLNESLPFEDNAFDVVVCQNGLHRVWARGRAMREFGRVAKPGGFVVFTFGNNNNIWRRLVYFISGSVIHDINGPPHNFYPDAENPAAFFRYPMTVAQVVSAMESVGLETIECRAISHSWKSIVLAPLGLFAILFRLFAPSSYRRFGFLAYSNCVSALFGDYLLVCAKKR